MSTTIEAPTLAERATPAELLAAGQYLQRLIGGKSEVYFSTRMIGAAAARCAVYPLGICGHGDDQHFDAPTWPGVFALAETWARNYHVISRDARIRDMALAIIDLTDRDGCCTKRGLQRREFSNDEIARLHVDACARAGEMAGNAPFRVEGV